MPDDLQHDDLDPALSAELKRAFAARLDVETAARHLWVLHRAARDQGTAVESYPDPTAELVGAAAPPRVRAWQRVLVPMMTMVALFFGASAAVAASATSLPGDVLYPVKRGTETAQLLFAGGPEAEAQLQLQFARTRLNELRAIADTRPDRVAQVVADMGASLDAAAAGTQDVAAETETLRQEAQETVAQLDVEVPDGALVAIAPPAEVTDTATATVEAATADPTEAATTTPVNPEAVTLPVTTSEPSPVATATPEPTDELPTDVATAPGTPLPTGPGGSPQPSPSASPTSSPTAAPSAEPGSEEPSTQPPAATPSEEPTGPRAEPEETPQPAPTGDPGSFERPGADVSRPGVEALATD